MPAAPAESTAAPEQCRHGLPVFPVRVRIMSPLFLSGHLPKLRITAKKRNSPLNIKRSQSMRVHLRISNPQSIKFFEKKGLPSYRERKKSQRILKETIPNIDFIH
ncbi:hypothetical protein [uncultured Akkermansia sp.]|uniref:hypothetical protein n=1 Tax=uncultured Akkermansia sp. TaxID=512294 RepID=UPI002598E313|nr:hypothetical protein [uncultured Akkermansia sp.]